MAPQQTHRSGFAALIGRPNVGKSTLLNQLTGEKLAIVSPKPQTTRNRILGVVTRPEGQVAFLDTPGIHQAKGELNRYMVDVALQAVDDVDLVLFVIEPRGAAEKPEVSPGNRFILERLQKAGKPTFLVINKIDTVLKPVLLPLIDLYRKEFPFAEVVPISAREGDGVEQLFQAVLQHMPEGEPLFPEDMLTDQAERRWWPSTSASRCCATAGRRFRTPRRCWWTSSTSPSASRRRERRRRASSRASSGSPPPSTWSATARRPSSSASRGRC